MMFTIYMFDSSVPGATITTSQIRYVFVACMYVSVVACVSMYTLAQLIFFLFSLLYLIGFEFTSKNRICNQPVLRNIQPNPHLL